MPKAMCRRAVWLWLRLVWLGELLFQETLASSRGDENCTATAPTGTEVLGTALIQTQTQTKPVMTPAADTNILLPRHLESSLTSKVAAIEPKQPSVLISLVRKTQALNGGILLVLFVALCLVFCCIVESMRSRGGDDGSQKQKQQQQGAAPANTGAVWADTGARQAFYQRSSPVIHGSSSHVDHHAYAGPPGQRYGYTAPVHIPRLNLPQQQPISPQHAPASHVSVSAGASRGPSLMAHTFNPNAQQVEYSVPGSSRSAFTGTFARNSIQEVEADPYPGSHASSSGTMFGAVGAPPPLAGNRLSIGSCSYAQSSVGAYTPAASQRASVDWSQQPGPSFQGGEDPRISAMRMSMQPDTDFAPDASTMYTARPVAVLTPRQQQQQQQQQQGDGHQHEALSPERMRLQHASLPPEQAAQLLSRTASQEGLKGQGVKGLVQFFAKTPRDGTPR